MPPRLNKRQLRELEELQALEASSHGEQVDREESEQEDVQVHKAPTGFTALMSAAGEDTPSEDDGVTHPSKSKKKKKKKKPSGVDTLSTLSAHQPESAYVATPSPEPGPSSVMSKKEKKALKRQKAKAAKDDGDDVDKALAALSMKYPELKKSTQTADHAISAPPFISLLQVSLSHLDSEAEMRKFFGAKVISASKASTPGPSSAAARRHITTTKSHLTRPQPTWWPAAYRQGLSSRTLTEDEIENRCKRHGWDHNVLGEKVWTVEYSRKYRGMTKMFMQMVMSGDPEGLFQILRTFPYHADTLLQLSEVYHHREEHSTAAEFIDRAMFTYERAFVGSFNFTSGLNRLDFDRVENRPFFLAIHRHVSDLQRRGCVRTAFEFARLLYSLDPFTDPHGALLHLDYLAIKAGMSDWLLDLWDAQCHLKDKWAGRMHVRALPGCAYARALALFIKEESQQDNDHAESTKALLDAVAAFPSVVPVLADKADISLPTELRGHPAFRIQTDSIISPNEAETILHLLSHLYAQRSFSIWKVKSRSTWFSSTLSEFAKNLSTSLRSPTSPVSPSLFLMQSLFNVPSLAYSVYRHVIVLEASAGAGRLLRFLPHAVTSGKQLACDPLPPPTRVNEYDAEFFQGAEDPSSLRPRGRREAQRLLERLVPDPVFRRQLQDFFEAHPHFAQRFPGGIVEFAQIAGQLPEELLEELMIAEVAAGQGGRGMPGQMPGEGIFDDVALQEPAPADPQRVDAAPAERFPGVDDQEDQEEEGDEVEEEEEIAPLPVRIIRNVFNRLWRGDANDAATESSDEEDADIPLRDDQGVD